MMTDNTAALTRCHIRFETGNAERGNFLERMASFRGLPLCGAVNFIFSFSLLHPHLKKASNPKRFVQSSIMPTSPAHSHTANLSYTQHVR